MRTHFEPPDDWEFVFRLPLNTLVIGASDRTGQLLSRLRPTLAEPVFSVDPSTSLVLPLRREVATLILENLDTVALDDQRRLMKWLDTVGPHPRVISISTVPLTRMMAEGTFLESLYYRLNQFCVEAN